MATQLILAGNYISCTWFFCWCHWFDIGWFSVKKASKSAAILWMSFGQKNERDNTKKRAWKASQMCRCLCWTFINQNMDSKNWLRNKDKQNILFATHKRNQFGIIITPCAPEQICVDYFCLVLLTTVVRLFVNRW